MQQQMPLIVPSPGRRGMSPASQSSGSSTSSKPSLLHRRRESSGTRQQEEWRTSAVKSSPSLPPLSIQTQPPLPISTPQDRRGRQAAPKSAPLKEARKFDRDNLPSMVKATTTHEPSNLKTVVFPSSPSVDGDGNQSDSSSICHSPTWEDYGKKKKKDGDAQRKRLTKGPPPAAMNNRPAANPRAFSDTALLTNQHSLKVESPSSSQQPNSTQTQASLAPAAPQSQPVEAVQTAPKSPAFIGGVRLEREREEVLKRLMNVRTPSDERPVSEVLLQSDVSLPKTDLAKKRATTAYPPTSSKTPFLPQPAPQTRPRRGSIGQGLKAAAGKLFSSKDHGAQPLYKKNDSQESIQTVQTWYSTDHRGRQMSGETVVHSRGQSYDSHDRSVTPKDGKKRGRISLPPVSWKNKHRGRTTSMIAVPPDSARDGSFPSDSSPVAQQDNFGFLERPFSPSVEGPLSPPGSLPASMKAKMSPHVTPSPVSSPGVQPSPKKTFKEAIKAGFRSSSSTPEPNSKRRRSGTNDTLVGSTIEIPLPADVYSLHGNPSAVRSEKGSPALRSKAAPYPEAQHVAGPVGHAQTGADPKDSGASSSSSHPETESQPSSPMTTPDTSRPQSSKDDQTLRIDDLKAMPMFSHDASNYAMTFPGLTALGAQSSGYFSPKKPTTPRVNVEAPDGSSKMFKAPTGRQRTKSGSSFTEDLPGSQQFMIDDDLFTMNKKPLDSDQLSFTSALTSLDVKRSFTDLDAAVYSAASPNADVTPLSLDKDSHDASRTKVTIKKVELQITQAPKSAAGSVGFSFKPSFGSDAPSRSPRSPDTSFLPTLPHQSLPPRANGRQTQNSSPTNEAEGRSLASHIRADSMDSLAQPSSKASAYLQEARKAAPSSPRAPPSKASSNTSLTPTGSPTTTALAGPRTFALSGPTTPSSPVPARAASPLSAAAVTASARSSIDGGGGGGVLGKPMTKMLVECCHCRFYHDMPSRVYEAMARPDDVVKDKKLGVSGQVTTCVKCPWCAHNMSTVCCAGYAAVVYLKEKLHGP